MEPMSLAAAVLTALAPYIAKGAEAVAEEVGKGAVGFVGGLFKGLKGRWRDKPEPQRALQSFLADPAAGREQFALALTMELARDPELSSQVERLLHGGAPELFVRQVVDDADEIVGVEAEEVKGPITVDQELRNVGKGVGIKAGKIG